VVAHTETSMPSLSAPVAFKDPMIRGSAIHIAYRIFAAFFIVMGAKTSIVENLFLSTNFSYGLFEQVQRAVSCYSQFVISSLFC